MTHMNEYRFDGGYPDDATVSAAYDAADLMRAVQCYKHFFPLVSGAMIFAGQAPIGVIPNRVFGYMDTRPEQAGFTLNSDTPYGGILLDLNIGPVVIEIPAGPVIGAVLNFDQSWITDVGIPGRDAGKGGSYLILPPGHTGDVPDGYFVAQAQTFKVLAGLRGIPREGDVRGALELLQTAAVHPLDGSVSWETPTWIDMSGRPQDTSPAEIQGTLDYWRVLHGALQDEPQRPDDRGYESELAVLGIERGREFAPDERMQDILARAAVEADAQLRVQSLADRRPDRTVWADRYWEWVTLRPENAAFEIGGRTDVDARETWFYQAIASSPAMFRRVPGGGSLYWFSGRDSDGVYLDGGREYTLRIPAPVPARLFWSVTVYDAITRSQIATDQSRAALRSMFELSGATDQGLDHVLRFGPEQPAAGEEQWVKTIPGRGWFVYLRLYGPTEAAFDGTWRPDDITAER